MKTPIHSAIAIAILLVVIAIIAILVLRHPVAPTQPTHFFGAIDASGSVAGELETNCLTIARCRHRLSPTDRSTMFRVDNCTMPFEDRAATGSLVDVAGSIMANVEKPSDHGGTFTEFMWRTLAERVGKDKRQSVIVFVSDGVPDWTTPAGHKRIKQYAEQLSNNPYLYGLVIIGVHAEAWAGLEADLAPLKAKLGYRFIILSNTDPDINPALELIDDAHMGHKEKP